MTHDELRKKALGRPDVREAFDDLSPEFELLRQMLRARRAAGLTQEGVAQRMGTKAPAVARLESALGNGKHSPSLSTLRKYADAVGCRLEIRLVPERE